MLNPLPGDNILDLSKLEQFADDNFKVDENSRKFSKRVENTVGKGQAVSAFLTMFSTLYGTYFAFYIHFKMSSATCFSLDQSEILSSSIVGKRENVGIFYLWSAFDFTLGQSQKFCLLVKGELGNK